MAESIFSQMGAVIHTSLNSLKTELEGDIATVQTNVDNSVTDISGLTTDLANEISRATTAETTLQTNITDESDTRSGADTTLQTNIDNEVTRAQAAESALQTSVDGKFNASGGEVTGHILPANDITYDLGSPMKMWRDVYVGPGSLYVNGQKVLEDNAGTITISADDDQNVQIKTGGGGDIEFYPSGTGNIDMKGNLSLQAGKKILSGDGQPIDIQPGVVNLNLTGDTTANNLNVSGNLTISGTTTTVNTETLNIADNIITLNSNATGVPTENAGLLVSRGDSANSQLIWDENVDEWKLSNDSTIFKRILVEGDITASTIGLDNVDNTSDVNKPISTSTQNALNLKLDVAGGTIGTGELSFGSTSRQMLNLWGTTYGIGIQMQTQYYRSINNFAWFKGGIHTTTTYAPGTGGTELMRLSDTEFQYKNNEIWHAGNDGTGSGLDADLLGGSSLATLQSSIDAKLGLAGGTLTGAVTIGTSATGGESSFQTASTIHTGQPYLNVPWVYTSQIEAPGERGTESTGIAVGIDGNHNLANDTVSIYTAGIVRFKVKSGGTTDFSTTPTVSGTTVSLSTHNHDSDYLGLTAQATDSALLGGTSLATLQSSINAKLDAPTGNATTITFANSGNTTHFQTVSQIGHPVVLIQKSDDALDYNTALMIATDADGPTSTDDGSSDVALDIRGIGAASTVITTYNDITHRNAFITGGGTIWSKRYIDAKLGLRENGTDISTKYLGISAKAADSELLDGYNASEARAGSTVVIRTPDSDIKARLLRSEYTPTNPTVNYVMTQVTPGVDTDNYVRSSTPEQFRAAVTDGVYLSIGGKSADSELLDGVDSAAYKRNDYNVDINVGGDADTYYPVTFTSGAQYSFGTYSISRNYSWAAPSTWNTASHKGGLTFTFQWSGDSAWGGNDKSIRVIEFSEIYSTMVGGMALSTGGGGAGFLVVWLRGGGAHYRLHTPAGAQCSTTVHLTGFTGTNDVEYPVRTDTSAVQGEIFSRYPIRGSGTVYVDGLRASDFAQIAVVNTFTKNQNVQNGDYSHIEFGPNSTWGASLRIGAGGLYPSPSLANVIVSNGNLHIDCAEGSYSTYFNWYNGAGGSGVVFGNGSAGIVASIDKSGEAFFNGEITKNNGEAVMGGTKHISTSVPTVGDGVDGDVWYRV